MNTEVKENNELKEYKEKIFDDIKHIDELGNEYWEARELMTALEYSKSELFVKVINKAKISCNLSGFNVNDHFPVKGKIVKSGATTKEVIDYKLSRYACYLIVQNASPVRHKSVALGHSKTQIRCIRSNLFCCSNKKYGINSRRI